MCEKIQRTPTWMKNIMEDKAKVWESHRQREDHDYWGGATTNLFYLKQSPLIRIRISLKSSTFLAYTLGLHYFFSMESLSLNVYREHANFFIK